MYWKADNVPNICQYLSLFVYFVSFVTHCSDVIFQFGGKLITFENVKPANPQVPVQRVVHVSQVVTETGLVTRSQQLEAALTNGNYADFCSHKASNTRDVAEQSIWNFMKVNTRY